MKRKLKISKTAIRKKKSLPTKYHGSAPDAVKLGEILKKIRLAKEITQPEIQEQTGMPLATISKIENGKTANPGFYTILNLCEVYGITLDSLLDEARSAG